MTATTAESESGHASDQATQTGLDENVAAAISYVLGWLTGIVMYLLESENEYVRFHAAQSIVVFGAIFVAGVVLNVTQAWVLFGTVTRALLGPIFALLTLGLWLGALVLWLYLLIRTYQGENPRIPVAAGIADDLV